MKKAVFLDRDGVINIEKNYLYKIEDFEFQNGVFEALSFLQENNYLLFIITNQSGIGRGYYTKNDFDILTSWMIEEFNKKSIEISQVELCPHSPNENCRCRKPDTQMIENILNNFQIDLEKSWLIGDKSSDIECAINSGIKNSIHIKTGHTFDESKSEASFICKDMYDVIKIISNSK